MTEEVHDFLNGALAAHAYGNDSCTSLSPARYYVIDKNKTTTTAPDCLTCMQMTTRDYTEPDVETSCLYNGKLSPENLPAVFW